jgi:hypothetical protein
MYLTVKEASDLTGKSATTIYRLCNKRRNSLYIKKEDNKFFIDKEFLLATYPLEEKRTVEIIENGSKETGEAVFLEIEPKQLEKSLLNANDIAISESPESKNATSLEESTEESSISTQNANVPESTNEVPTSNKAENTDTSTILSKAPETGIVPFYKKKAFWERAIGASIMLLALIALLILFYTNVK